MQILYKMNTRKDVWRLKCKQKAKNINKIGEKVVSLPDNKHY